MEISQTHLDIIQNRGLARRLIEILFLKSSHNNTLPPNISEVKDVGLDFPLFRSGLPQAQHFAGLKNLGIKKIISLSDCKDEFIAAIKEWEFQHDILKFSNRNITPENMLKVVEALRSENHATLIHCLAGANRTGSVIATLRWQQQDWDMKRIKSEMIRFGHFPIFGNKGIPDKLLPQLDYA
jgi:protein tyrosine/serine phosphatase